MATLRKAEQPTLLADAGELLRGALQAPSDGPFAVMVTGGTTPLELYRRLAAQPFPVHPLAHVAVSDERVVPLAAPESNYGHLRGLLDALALPEACRLYVHPDAGLEAAAARYDAELAAFRAAGGRVTLALLGLGADGHVASLFRAADVAAGAGRCAIPVQRPAPPARVSVTADLLRQAERVVFLVQGAAKREAVERLLYAPATIPAGLVFASHPAVEVWWSV